MMEVRIHDQCEFAKGNPVVFCPILVDWTNYCLLNYLIY
jgi:hypothetical protein